jgi:site-specific DNA recombinase
MYTGTGTTLRYQAVRNGNGRTTMRRREADGQIPLPDGAVPALVDRETFEAVHHRLTRNKELATRNAHHPEASLLRGGYARCGYCGRAIAFNGHNQGGRYGQYRCPVPRRDCAHRPTISAGRLDAAVWQHIAAVLTDPHHIARGIERMQGADPTTADLAVVDRQIADTRRRIGNLTAHLADLPPEAAAAVACDQLVTLSQRLEPLEAERAVIQDRRIGGNRHTTPA